MKPPFPGNNIHVSDYYRVLRKRRGVLFTFLALALIFSLLLALFSEPVYEATSKVMIGGDRVESPISAPETRYENYQSQLLTFNTHFDLIKSDPVIKMVIHALQLDRGQKGADLPVGFFNITINRIKTNVRALLKMEQKTLAPHEQEQQLINMVKEKIRVSQVRDTRLMTISVRDRKPRRAAEIADMVAQKYIEFDLNQQMEATSRQLEWMQNELYLVKKKLEDEEKNFFAFKQEENIFSLAGKKDMKEQKIREFNEQFLKIKHERQQLDATLDAFQQILKNSGGIVNVRSLTDNPTLDKLYHTIVELKVDLNALSRIYKSKHPIIIQHVTKLEKSQKRFEEELTKELDNLKARRAMLVATEDRMQEAIASFEAEALDASGRELAYIMHQRRVEENRHIYDSLMAGIRESDLVRNSGFSSLSIVMPAQVPLTPVFPRKKKNLLIGLVIGLAGGIFLSFFAEYMDRTIRNETDVQTYLDLPVLAVVPRAEAKDMVRPE